MYNVFQFLCFPCYASCNSIQKLWQLKLHALTAVFPFSYFFSLDIVIFNVNHTYFSVFDLILVQFLIPDIWM